MQNFSKSEREIMSVFWAENRPLSSAEVVELCPNKTWKANSIHMFLNSLLDKKAIRVAGIAVHGKYASRSFIATSTETQEIIQDIIESNSFKKGAFQALSEILSSLVREVDLTDAQCDELHDILTKAKK